MPRISNRAFSDEFSHRRDLLLAAVRRHTPTQEEGLRAAGQRLDDTYSDVWIRKKLKEKRRLQEAKERGQPGGAQRRGPAPAASKPERLTAERRAAERLARAIADAVAANRGQGLTRPLGQNLPSGEREANAWYYVVVCSLVLDANAPEWLGAVTELASCPWGTQTKSRAYTRRADVCRDWGHEALRLLEESCRALGWVPAGEPASATPAGPGSPATGTVIPMRVIAIDVPRPDPPRSLAEQVAALHGAFDRFYELLDAMTVRCEGGRRVDGAPQAVALSEATSVLHAELGFTYQAIIHAHGQPLGTMPAGITLSASNSPRGPGTPIPPSQIGAHRVKMGSGGADAILLATLERASRVAGFETARWNAKQAARPAPHQRWHAGDIVTTEDLEALKSASRSLQLTPRSSPLARSGAAERIDDLVTLDQMAAVVGRVKKTLERYLGKHQLPEPDFRGGNGKAHRWYWSKVRPALMKLFRPDIPERFPASRIIH